VAALGLGAGLLGLSSPGCSRSSCQWLDDERTHCGSECVELSNNPLHCGACFNECAAPIGDSAWCASGRCYAAADLRVLADTIEGLAVDERAVYLTTGCGGRILTVDKGGVNEQTLAEQQLGARSIAVDDERVYWGIDCRPPGCCAGSTEIASAPRAGGPVEPLSIDDLPSAAALALDAQSVYFSTAHGVLSVPKTGGSVSTLIDGGSFGAIAVGGGYLYAAGYRAAQTAGWAFDLYRVPLAGGAVERLTEGRQVQSLAVDADYLYVASCSEPTLTKIPLGGSAETALSPSHRPTCDELQPRAVVGGGWLYLSSGHSVYRLPLAGGEATQHLQLYAAERAGTLGLDAERLYLSTGHTVLSAAR